jgi:hypothetical protein
MAHALFYSFTITYDENINFREPNITFLYILLTFFENSHLHHSSYVVSFTRVSLSSPPLERVGEKREEKLKHTHCIHIVRYTIFSALAFSVVFSATRRFWEEGAIVEIRNVVHSGVANNSRVFARNSSTTHGTTLANY